MDLDHLKQLLDLVQQHGLAEFEIEQDGLRLKIRKEVTTVVATSGTALPAAPPRVGGAIGVAGPSGPVPAGEASETELEIEFAVVKSPIVGTFYRAPEPAAPPFVDIGTTVKKGQVLCIIEAMKLMNEIDAEFDGEIVKIYVENGQSVQYGERLFAIKAG
jgi:acetyl-CoA carboxylase biotin carboxyl carrier protein